MNIRRAAHCGEVEERGEERTVVPLERRNKVKKLLLSVAAVVLACLYSGLAMAVEASAAAPADSVTKGAIAISAGLAIAIAAFGAALGQGRVGAAAMESIGRNPNAADRIFLPLILGLAFIEALALYGFVIAFLLQAKI